MDLKRLLAWSTCSQLGEMMIALGLGGPLAATLHLAAHAVFKSTLFLAAGAVQEQTGTRALDRFGGLIRSLPLTGAVFLAAALALAGVPPLSGFWSEEAILGVAAPHGLGAALLIVLLVLLGGIYIGRATTATFFGERRHSAKVGKPARTMHAGMVLLAFAAAGLGWTLAGRLAGILAFPAEPEPGTMWRILGIGAAFVGLGFGVVSNWRGAAPALGLLPARLGAGLMTATEAPAIWAMRIAQVLNPIEAAFDKGAQGMASSVWRLALDTERVEALGFGEGGNHLAADIASGGEWLRALQAGRLYLYTLALFGWAAAALAVGGLMLWL
jgi:NADH-quinone oxidoreductase subunit L